MGRDVDSFFDIIHPAFSSVDRNVAHPPMGPEGWFWKGYRVHREKKNVLVVWGISRQRERQGGKKKKRKKEGMCKFQPCFLLFLDILVFVCNTGLSEL